MPTVNEWVDEVREILAPGVIEQVNRLANDYIPGDGEITLEREITGVVPGQVITCGLNTFLVWNVDATAKTIEVETRWAGSQDVVMEEGSIVRLKPNIYTHRIFKAINDTILELSSPMVGLYAVATQDLDYTSAMMVYDLSDCEQIDRVLRVQWGYPDDTQSEWQDFPASNWQHRQLEATADFPSGHQLRVFEDPMNPPGNGSTLRIIYTRPLSTVDSLGASSAMTLLPETAWDVPVLGAAARLAASQEFRRNMLQGQPDTRRANEVQPYALLNAYKSLQADYTRRVEQELARLVAAHPPKMW